MNRYQQILANKKGEIHSMSKGPIIQLLEFMKTKEHGFVHRGNNYTTTIKSGFLVRHYKWNNGRMYDIHELDGTLLFLTESEKNAPIKPFCGTFKREDEFKDVIKRHLREKKLMRLLEGVFDDETTT